ncbi:MAG: SAM-dependent methyltransferase [Nocardioidaceae bacterium]
MAESLQAGLARVRASLLAPDLVRGLASGRQRNATLEPKRAEVRPVALKAGARLQVVTLDATQAYTQNYVPGPAAEAAVDALLALPFANWHVETATETVRLRVTKKGAVLLHVGAGVEPGGLAHDRAKARLLPADDPVLAELGISDAAGRIKPSRQAKYRQVEEFLRALDAGLNEIALPAVRPLRVVDLGCGNAYLTFAAYRYLAAGRGLDVEVVGVDRKAQSLEHNTAVAKRLGLGDSTTFVQAAIGPEAVRPPVDVVLALHACDTATDDALAAAVSWGAALVLAAPCCHHDLARQLRAAPPPPAYSLLTRDGILRERFGDTLTDALRAALLRQVGYRVEVMEFVESKHTPRNTLLRAVRTGAPANPAARSQLDELVVSWGLKPRLGELLADRLTQ